MLHAPSVPAPVAGLRTLLAHEWLAPTGGSENVFEALADVIRPDRRLCLWNDAPARFGDVEESWLSRTPAKRNKAVALPLMPAAWRSCSLGDVDRVIVSSHAFAHHLAGRAARRGIASYAYIHTPARYVWAPDLDVRGASNTARLVSRMLKPWDRRAASDLVQYAANSTFVRQRVQESWGVDSRVIYPPVDVERIQQVDDWLPLVADGREQDRIERLPDSFVLGASRLVPYKRLDLAIRLGETLGLPVVIAGDGPDRPRLESISRLASVPVDFLGRVSTEALYALYARASVFSFLPIEDFGIMPVEAIASGTPVVVSEFGGARESAQATGGGFVASGPLDSTRSEIDAFLRAVEPSELKASARAKFSQGAFSLSVRGWLGE